MGTAGGAIIISIIAAVISLGSLTTTIVFAVRNERGKKAELLRDSRQRLLFQVERLRLWMPQNRLDDAWGAEATLRAILNEEPTCVSDRKWAGSYLENIHYLTGQIASNYAGRESKNEMADLATGHGQEYIKEWVRLKTELENECAGLLELATPSDAASRH